MHRLAIHTITTKQWDLPAAVKKYSAAGIKGVGVWRQWLGGRALAESRSLLDDHGLAAVSLVRGGFFPGVSETERQSALDDNRRALDEAAAIGAPQVVLVCGAKPELSLAENRKQISAGIAACIDHAAALGVKLAIEPLHPMYADCRSAINTLGQRNDLIDQLGVDLIGIAADVYHIWWDPMLEAEIRRAGKRIIGFHVCDWLTPTNDFLNDRGLMGEGCIDIKGIRAMVEAAGFQGPIEVEIFSNRHWSRDPDEFFQATFELEGGIIAHFNSSWTVRVRRDDLLAVQVDGEKGTAVCGLRDVWIQHYGNTPRPVWNPDIPQQINFHEGWSKVPDQETYDNAFKIQWELFLRHIVRDEPFPWNLLSGAKGVQFAELGIQSWKERRWVDVPEII